jgi:hypothetical protein
MVCYDVSLLAPNEDHVVWCISGDAFLERCEYYSEGDYRITPWAITPPHGPYIRMAECVMSATVNLSGDILGNHPVSYVEYIYGNDASNQPILENTVNTQEWSFLDSSFGVTLRWDTNGEGGMRVRMDEGALVRVEKRRNDAACDNIQIVCDASARTVDSLNITSSSADVLTASFDYSKKFNTTSEVMIGEINHTLSANDASFTEFVVDNSMGAVITDSSGLRSCVSTLIDIGEFVGFSLDTVNIRCSASLSLETTISFEVPLKSYFLFF